MTRRACASPACVLAGRCAFPGGRCPEGEVEHVRQLDVNGCSMASVAMILGHTYEEMRDRYGDPETGWDYFLWKEVLARHGYAWQFLWRGDPFTKEHRTVWPPLPWAPIHICCVEGGFGPGTHQVVMDREGVVFDPNREGPRLLSDYPSVAYVAGVFHVGAKSAGRGL